MLAVVLLQPQQKNQAALGPALLASQIVGVQDATAWIRGLNKPEDARYRPESTPARQPTSFKKARGIEKYAMLGIPEDLRLGNYKKRSNIKLTAWVNSLRGYLKERGLDTVFRIFDPVSNT